MEQKNRSGFTLIELFVVISIIGFLASTIIVSINSSKIKARDNKRITDMLMIQKALEMYYDDNLQYPNVNQLVWSTNASNALQTALVPKYLSALPFNALRYYYDSDSGDNYQTYGLMTWLEHPQNIDSLAKTDNGYAPSPYAAYSLYEFGTQPQYCISKPYTAAGKYWWSVDSVCVGGN